MIKSSRLTASGFGSGREEWGTGHGREFNGDAEA
jgi:hypothetical protein